MPRTRIWAFVLCATAGLAAGAGEQAPPVHDSTVSSGSSVNALPFQVGIGGLIAVTAAFALGRMCRPNRPRVNKPVNLIKRLDDLEKLRDLGVLTPEEFETEKNKLRHSV